MKLLVASRARKLEGVPQQLAAQLADAKTSSIDHDFRVRHANGEWLWLRARCEIVHQPQDGGPHPGVIPIAMRNPNFELRTHSWVTKVLKDSSGKRVTGVTYTNVLNGEEFEQPAGLVVLCAYAINNVHLMLLSGIGKPYDPVAQTGVIGKNYCYQTGAGATLFFEGKYFNPFMSTGGLSARVDDFHSNWEFDRGQYGYTQSLLRTVAYDTLSRRERKATHLAVAGHLRATFATRHPRYFQRSPLTSWIANENTSLLFFSAR